MLNKIVCDGNFSSPDHIKVLRIEAIRDEEELKGVFKI